MQAIYKIKKLVSNHRPSSIPNMLRGAGAISSSTIQPRLRK